MSLILSGCFILEELCLQNAKPHNSCNMCYLIIKAERVQSFKFISSHLSGVGSWFTQSITLHLKIGRCRQNIHHFLRFAKIYYFGKMWGRMLHCFSRSRRGSKENINYSRESYFVFNININFMPPPPPQPSSYTLSFIQSRLWMCCTQIMLLPRRSTHS